MRTIAEAVEDIKSILNNVERTENCDGETLVDINALADEILIIGTYKGQKQTNADRIRHMSDEELADFLCKVKSDYQWLDHEFPSEEESEEWVEWLQSEGRNSMGKLSEYINQTKVEINGRKFVDEKLMLELLDSRILEERKEAENEDERNAYDYVRNIIANW